MGLFEYEERVVKRENLWFTREGWYFIEKQEKGQPTNPTLMRQMSQSREKFFSQKLIALLAIVALLGVGSGYLLAKGGKITTKSNNMENGSSVSKGTIVGSTDTKTFKDTAEGVLQEGGVDGEGQYHLVRPGGESQNVYLTSSIVDLSKFIKRKVKVWGETNKAQKAGWLMDVGKVEVLE